MAYDSEIENDGLMKRICSDDLPAFEQLVHAYQDGLYRFICRLLQSEELAKDILQDVFVTLWQRRKTVQIHCSLSAYLYRCAKNAAMNALRQQRTNRRYFVPLDGKHQQVPVHESAADPVLQQAIEHCIGALPDGCRTVFTLSRFEQLKYREIAHTLDISVKTVENQMARALKLLRQCLQPFLGED